MESHTLDLKSRHWRFRTQSRILIDPLILEEELIVGCTPASLTCLDLETGKEQWRFSMGSGEIRGMAAVENRIITCSDDGCVTCLDRASRDTFGAEEH